MPSEIRRFGVYLHQGRAGTIEARGQSVAFAFSHRYLDSVDRPVLGLQFEEDLEGRWTGQGRLPPWFSNLLPEGRLRTLLDEVIEKDGTDASPLDEVSLLERLGLDLPGAVTIQRVLEGDDDEPLLLEDLPHSGQLPDLGAESFQDSL